MTSPNTLNELWALAFEIESILMSMKNRADDELTIDAAMPLIRRKIGLLNEIMARTDAAPIETPSVASDAPVAPVAPAEPIEAAIAESVATEVEEQAEGPAAVEAEVPASAPAPQSQQKRHLQFTLNDKFLFRRELFCGDSRQFDEAVKLIEEMPTYADAESYLADACGWDLEQPVVAQFIAVVKDSFKN